MTQEELKQTLKDKLKECNKNILVNIIIDLCILYIGAKACINMMMPNTVQDDVQDIINFTTKRIKIYSDDKRE